MLTGGQHGKSRRKGGGQSGHPKDERSLRPANKCDDVVLLKASDLSAMWHKTGGAPLVAICVRKLSENGWYSPVISVKFGQIGDRKTISFYRVILSQPFTCANYIIRVWNRNSEAYGATDLLRISMPAMLRSLKSVGGFQSENACRGCPAAGGGT